MYSEKLKKLVKDKVPLKFRIKDKQQSKELQEFLFALDVYYMGSGTQILYDDCPYLSVYENAPGIYILGWGLNPNDFYLSDELQEFDLENDCLVEEKERKIELKPSQGFYKYDLGKVVHLDCPHCKREINVAISFKTIF